jgi:hypothetical protein
MVDRPHRVKLLFWIYCHCLVGAVSGRCVRSKEDIHCGHRMFKHLFCYAVLDIQRVCANLYHVLLWKHVAGAGDGRICIHDGVHTVLIPCPFWGAEINDRYFTTATANFLLQICGQELGLYISVRATQCYCWSCVRYFSYSRE